MKLGDIFNIEYGQREYHNKGNLKLGNTLLISSQGSDSGCYGFFNILPKYKPPIITVPSTGSVGIAFVQTTPCCVDDNCLVLIPKSEIDIESIFQVTHFIRLNRWRFLYGRQITPYRLSRMEFKGIPLGDKYVEIEKKLMPKDLKNKFEVNRVSNKNFKLVDFFKIAKGKGAYYEKLRKGKVPLVSATSDNNGVVGYVDIKPTFRAPAITLERIKGIAFVQLFDFVTVPDDIFVLIPKEYKYVEFLLYVISQLSNNQWRFNYARKVTPKRLSNTKIKLPVDKNNKVDMAVIKDIVANLYCYDKIIG